MKFSYVDDVAILQLDHTLLEGIENSEKQVEVLLKW